MNYPILEDKWISEEKTLAFEKGVRLVIVTRFDGNGNSVVRFYVRISGKNIMYEKHDSAASAYNFECRKLIIN